MNMPDIDVPIKYQRNEDPETKFLRLPAVPRVGDFIVPKNGRRYRVVAVVFEENTQGEARPWIEVAPV